MHLIETLQDVVGTDNVLTGDDVRRRSVSWADHSPCQALAIVRPAATNEVSGVLAACNAAGQAVVPMGWWQQARSLGPWTLVGCTVAPGFTFDGFVLAPAGLEPPLS